MILTVAFRFFRNVPHGAHLAINDRNVEEDMGQDIVLYPPHVPETISFYNFSIIIYISHVIATSMLNAGTHYSPVLLSLKYHQYSKISVCTSSRSTLRKQMKEVPTYEADHKRYQG
jgi:hypothetical protein